jgi:hypothetical protein
MNTATRSSWGSVEWAIAGEVVPARFLRFAAGWAAYTAKVDGVWLSAIGTTPEPSDLHFATTDGRDYGVDFNEPLDFPASLIQSRARVLPPSDPAQRPRSHPDRSLLMDDL